MSSTEIQAPQPRSLKWIRPLLVSVVVVLIIIQIVALMPSSLDEGGTGSITSGVTLESMIRRHSATKTLAHGIPKDQFPEYTIEKFNYVSTQSNKKQWQLLSERAFLYNKERIVHA